MENQSEIGRMFARAEAAFSGGARGEQEDAKDRIFEAARSWPGHAGMFLERIAGLGGKAKRALISDARFWELLGGVRMPKGEASSPPNFGGFEEAAEGWGESGGSHWIGWADRWVRTGSETTAALRGARALGRIREMGDAGLGGAWLRRMIEIGNLEGAKMAEREGVRLSGMSSGQSAQMLLEIARSRSREMAEFWRERGWAPLRKKAEREREREIIAADSLAKRELWDLAIRAGAPEPDFRGVSPSELRRVPEIGGIKALAREIERSGRVGPGSAPLLAFAALASESGMRIYERELELEGPAPLSEGDWIALGGQRGEQGAGSGGLRPGGEGHRGRREGGRGGAGPGMPAGWGGRAPARRARAAPGGFRVERERWAIAADGAVRLGRARRQGRAGPRSAGGGGAGRARREGEAARGARRERGRSGPLGGAGAVRGQPGAAQGRGGGSEGGRSGRQDDRALGGEPLWGEGAKGRAAGDALDDRPRGGFRSQGQQGRQRARGAGPARADRRDRGGDPGRPVGCAEKGGQGESPDRSVRGARRRSRQRRRVDPDRPEGGGGGRGGQKAAPRDLRGAGESRQPEPSAQGRNSDSKDSSESARVEKRASGSLRS